MSSHLRKPRTILFAANFPSDTGYAWWLMEDFWITLARFFEATHRPLIAYPRITRLSQPISTSGIQTIELDTAPTSIRQMIVVGRQLRRLGVRVLYLSDQPVHSVRYLIYRAFGVSAIIVHDHSPGHRPPPSSFKRLLKSGLARFSPTSASALVSTSEFVLDRHRRITCFPPSRLFLAQNGIPLDLPAQQPAFESFAIPSDRTLVVASSRAHPIKGIHYALNALGHIVHQLKRTDIHFLYFGDGPSLSALRAHSEQLAVSSYVTFAGEIENPSSYFGDCAVGLHLSSAEVGYSLSVLEMMRAGIPVVVNQDRSVSGATLDGRTGIHVNPNNPQEVATALLTLADDASLRARMGCAAKEHLSRNFSLHVTRTSLTEAMSVIVGSRLQEDGGEG